MSDPTDPTAPQPPGGSTAKTADTPTIDLAEAATRPAAHPHPRPAQAGRLAPGQRFGGYRIHHLLGAGGMGEVYDCEHEESGRRLALKTLSVSLSDASDRSRFLREGRMAAALSHPHSIYVFGSEEIDGVPVIAMELVAGGTLRDLVKQRGPLPPAEAVSIIRQVIAGLANAAAAGILHRDIKPANCFVDAAGAVKVGDFGLSVSTMKAETFVTIGATVLGTPAFASPEQLRGEELDVRSDIYSVGATLFYLLTAQQPFTDDNLMRLLSRVAGDPPPPVRSLQPAVPEGLAAIVDRCLAKKAAQRFADYAALDAALEPFTMPLAPAPPWARVPAAIIDQLVISVATGTVAMALLTDIRPNDVRGLATDVLLGTLYYGWLEGRFGAAAGKAALAMRVTRESGEAPGFRRAAARGAIFMIAVDLGSWLAMTAAAGAGFRSSAYVVAPFLGTGAAAALLFAIARGATGYRGFHELWTGTRVVRAFGRREVVAEVRHRASEAARTVIGHAGPYALVQTAAVLPAGVRLAFDERLQRHVWIHHVPPGTPAVCHARRDLAWPTRLRWLGGKRGATESESWDAYEAPEAEPFAGACRTPQPWSLVRRWLEQLSEEFAAAAAGGTAGARRVTDLWITRTHDLKVIDLDHAVAESRGDLEGALLLEVAGAALEPNGRAGGASLPRIPLPLSARALLADIRDGVVPRGQVVERLRAMAREPTAVSSGRRAGQISLAAAPLLFVLMCAMVAAVMFGGSTPGLRDLGAYGARLRALERGVAAADADEPRRLRLLIARRLHDLVPSGQQDAVVTGFLAVNADLYDRVRRDTPVPGDDAFQAAEREQRQADAARGRREPPWQFVVALVMTLGWLIAAMVAMVSSLLLKGGLSLSAASIAVVTSDGTPAGRLRCAIRALVTWSPVLAAAAVLFIAPIALRSQPGWTMFVAPAVCLLVFAAGAAAAFRSPSRGWQDRVAGTWLVPR